MHDPEELTGNTAAAALETALECPPGASWSNVMGYVAAVHGWKVAAELNFDEYGRRRSDKALADEYGLEVVAEYRANSSRPPAEAYRPENFPPPRYAKLRVTFGRRGPVRAVRTRRAPRTRRTTRVGCSARSPGREDPEPPLAPPDRRRHP